MIIKAYKNKYETPLECINRVRTEQNIPSDVSMTYAGRLDPLAFGVMYILTDDDVHRKTEITDKDKVYKMKILLGIGTDTGDILGMPTNMDEKAIEIKKVKEVAESYIGEFEQEYPAYSSKTVDGIPLFAYAKSGRIPSHHPTKLVKLHGVEWGSEAQVSAKELLVEVDLACSNVHGDFRQKEIKSAWHKMLDNSANSFNAFDMTLSVSSGFYVRAFADNLGKALGTHILAYGIERLSYRESAK